MCCILPTVRGEVRGAAACHPAGHHNSGGEVADPLCPGRRREADGAALSPAGAGAGGRRALRPGQGPRRLAALTRRGAGALDQRPRFVPWWLGRHDSCRRARRLARDGPLPCATRHLDAGGAAKPSRPRFKGSWPGEGMFYSGRVHVYGVTAIAALRHPLRKLAARVPHGEGASADQARGPVAVGAGGRTPAHRGGAHRSLLSAAPGPWARVWPWRGGPAPGAARWAACPLSGGGPAGGAREAPLAPGWPEPRGAER
jgi:hypothetical protein